MLKSYNSVASVKQTIEGFQNKDLSVKVNLGRNKFVSFSGKLTAIYPALFTITPTDNFSGKTTYSYQEFMCGKVSISTE